MRANKQGKGEVKKEKPVSQTSVIYAPAVKQDHEKLVMKICKKHFDKKEYDQTAICKFLSIVQCLSKDLTLSLVYSYMDITDK